MDLLSERPNYFREFESKIINMIVAPEIAIAEKALSNIPDYFLEEKNNQIRIIDLIDTAQYEIKLGIINRMQNVNKLDNAAMILLLDKFNSDRISSGVLNLIYNMLTNDMLQNKMIENKLINLSKSSNIYVALLTNNILKKHGITISIH